MFTVDGVLGAGPRLRLRHRWRCPGACLQRDSRIEMKASFSTNRRLPRSGGSRCAFTLLEVVAVIAVLALLSAAAIATFRTNTFGNYGSQIAARQLAVDLMQSRRRAITEGYNHLVVFESSGGQVIGYTVRRRDGGSTVIVDPLKTFPQPMTVTSPAGDPEFNFEGAALSSYTITLAAPDRTWQVIVAQATGSVTVTES